MSALREADEVFCVGLAADMVASAKNRGWMQRLLKAGDEVFVTYNGPAPLANDERVNVWLASIIEHVRCT